MSNRRCVIFDLDGTLTESGEGIIKSVAAAAEEVGFPRPDQETLLRFIGPPLKWSYQTYLGMNEEQAVEAAKAYRRRYNTVGLFENRVYPGIRRLLRTLRQQGCWLAIATGKPQEVAQRIAEHFRLDIYLDRVIGTGEFMGSDKDMLIRAALPEDPGEVWMVGDRRFDIEGAVKVGVKSLGAGYGYGTEEELRTAGCTAYAHTVQEAIDILCGSADAPEGAFLSMEGLDGSGKTTQLSLLTEALDRYGFEVVHSREPGGCPISEKIRSVLLDPENKEMCAETEALLYAAGRAQHVRDVIVPTVQSGKVLLSDRYVDSSVAYQGGGRGLGVQQVLDINAPAVKDIMPLATVYLDIGHEESLRRRKAASDPDRIEREGGEFFARVEDAYHELIRRDPDRFVVVDATEAPEVIGKKVADEVIRRLVEAELQ